MNCLLPRKSAKATVCSSMTLLRNPLGPPRCCTYVGPARGTDARRVEAVGFGKKLPFGGADTVLGKAGGLPFRILTTAAILLLQRLYDRRKDQRSEGVCHCGASFQQSCTDQRPNSLAQDVRSADVCWTQGFRFTLSQRVSQFHAAASGGQARARSIGRWCSSRSNEIGRASCRER